MYLLIAWVCFLFAPIRALYLALAQLFCGQLVRSQEIAKHMANSQLT